MSEGRDLSRLAPEPTQGEAEQLRARNRQLELVLRQRAVDHVIETVDGLTFLFDQAIAGDPAARLQVSKLDRLLSQARLASAGWPSEPNGKAKDG